MNAVALRSLPTDLRRQISSFLTFDDALSLGKSFLLDGQFEKAFKERKKRLLERLSKPNGLKNNLITRKMLVASLCDFPDMGGELEFVCMGVFIDNVFEDGFPRHDIELYFKVCTKDSKDELSIKTLVELYWLKLLPETYYKIFKALGCHEGDKVIYGSEEWEANRQNAAGEVGYEGWRNEQLIHQDLGLDNYAVDYSDSEQDP